MIDSIPPLSTNGDLKKLRKKSSKCLQPHNWIENTGIFFYEIKKKIQNKMRLSSVWFFNPY